MLSPPGLPWVNAAHVSLREPFSPDCRITLPDIAYHFVVKIKELLTFVGNGYRDPHCYSIQVRFSSYLIAVSGDAMPKSQSRATGHTLLDWHLTSMDDAFQKKTWHGPNLKGSLRGGTREQALWRIRPERKNIWEIMLHAAYWKYTVGRRLRKEKRGSFPLAGANWFSRDMTQSEMQWREEKRMLDSVHRWTRDAVADLREIDLSAAIDDGKSTYDELLRGIAFHDVYHAGKIQILKKQQLENV